MREAWIFGRSGRRTSKLLDLGEMTMISGRFTVIYGDRSAAIIRR